MVFASARGSCASTPSTSFWSAGSSRALPLGLAFISAFASLDAAPSPALSRAPLPGGEGLRRVASPLGRGRRARARRVREGVRHLEDHAELRAARIAFNTWR